MVIPTQKSPRRGGGDYKRVRLGFVPLTDAAPLIMAHELELFDKYGLKVELSRELGWATIRDKVLYRELDASHGVAGMPFSTSLGLGCVPCECVSGLILSSNGNAITVSKSLWNDGVRDAQSLGNRIRAKDRPFTFGIVFRYATHNFLLRRLLLSAGLHPDRDVQIVVVPPPQLVPNLCAGNIDGFCAGEPWNSVAYAAGAGRLLTCSSEIDPEHPDKLLLARRDFVEDGSDRYLALVAALIESCAFCDDRRNAATVSEVLSRSEYVGASKEIILRGLLGQFQFKGESTQNLNDFIVFSRNNTNRPSSEKATWILQQMLRCGLIEGNGETLIASLKRCFLPSLFEDAKKLVGNSKLYEEPQLA